MLNRWAKKSLRYVVHNLVILFSVALTLILVHAFAACKMADLESWHEEPIEHEFVSADYSDEFSLADYVSKEDALFDKLENYKIDADHLGGISHFSRFVSDGPQDPARQKINWNKTVELIPEEVKGGVLLVHGLSDSP
jgi:hypothetical protein